jgi:LmbE family N-acetylglucosaminyl deacetylase
MSMTDQPLRILAIGAHPDDCDIKAGGVAALYRRLGHTVRFVSVTNGDAGHHRLRGEELAAVRRAEAQAAAKILDIQYDVLNHSDGRLEPTLAAREEMIALIRTHNPDVIFTHRPNDYHPDHRYTSQLVCDAAYMVTVPAIVPGVHALRRNPVIMYLSDRFERPYPFSPSIVVDIEPVLETVVDLLDCHKSQFYEWLAYNFGYEGELPAGAVDRRKWLRGFYCNYIASLADRHRRLIVETYGSERGNKIQHVEAFELCEYGAPLTPESRRRLFPFLPY